MMYQHGPIPKRIDSPCLRLSLDTGAGEQGAATPYLNRHAALRARASGLCLNSHLCLKGRFAAARSRSMLCRYRARQSSACASASSVQCLVASLRHLREMLCVRRQFLRHPATDIRAAAALMFALADQMTRLRCAVVISGSLRGVIFVAS